MCCRIVRIYVLNLLVWCPLRYPHKDDVGFVFISSCLYGGSCRIYVTCVCLRIVVSNTYCVVFLLYISSSCVPYVASYSGLSIFYCPSVSSNIYFNISSYDGFPTTRQLFLPARSNSCTHINLTAQKWNVCLYFSFLFYLTEYTIDGVTNLLIAYNYHFEYMFYFAEQIIWVIKLLITVLFYLYIYLLVGHMCCFKIIIYH